MSDLPKQASNDSHSQFHFLSGVFRIHCQSKLREYIHCGKITGNTGNTGIPIISLLLNSHWNRSFFKVKETFQVLLYFHCSVCCVLSFYKCLLSLKGTSPVRFAMTFLKTLLFCHVATASVKPVWKNGGERKKFMSVHFVRKWLS